MGKNYNNNRGEAGVVSGRGWGIQILSTSALIAPQFSQIVLNGLFQGRDIFLDGGRGKGEGTGSSASAIVMATTVTITMTFPFISINTSGVFCPAFCDFGPKFNVANEDKGVPKETLLDEIKVKTKGGDGEKDGKGEVEGEGASNPLVMLFLER